MHRSPDVEQLEDDRYRVTVRFHDADAEDVFVIGALAGADPFDRRMRREDDGWWSRSYEVPGGSRLSYWFTRKPMPDEARDLAHDPLNPSFHVYPGDPADPEDAELRVSLVELPGAPPLRWSVQRDVARGAVDVASVPSAALGNERRVWTYRPPGYDPGRRYPLVVCFDGFAYVTDGYVPLPTVLDNLIADGAIPPVVAVLPDSLDQPTRTRELSAHEPFVHFLADELLPWARERLSFDDDPLRTVVAGSSLGGLTASFCGLRRPDLFGLVLSQSGAYQRGEPALFAASARLPLRFYLDVGSFERMIFEGYGSLYHANLHMRDVLLAKGYDDVTFREFPGGHDYFWWRETIADGLVALLG
jgi:enterochelin esterase family protein